MSTLAVMIALAAAVLPAAPAPAAEIIPTVPGAISREYDGGDLRIRRDLAGTSAYSRHAITYRSGGADPRTLRG